MNLILNRITQGFGVLALGFMIFVSFYLTQTGLHAVGTNFQGLFIVLCALVLLVLHIVLTMLQLKKEKLAIFLLFILSMVGFYLIAYPGMHSTDTFLIADRGVTGLVTSSCSIFYSFYILGIRMIDSHLILLNIFQNLLLIYLVGQLFLQFNSTRLQMLLGILALNLMGMWYFVNISSRDHL